MGKMKQSVQDLTDNEWWSPAQILKLLRNLRSGDVFKLAEHPIAKSNMVQLYVSHENSRDSQYNLGLGVFSFIAALLNSKLDRERSASGQKCGQAKAAEPGINLDLTKIDVTSGSRELMKWEMFVNHYIHKMSIRELSTYLGYSSRQVLYYLQEVKKEFIILLLEQEKLSSVGINSFYYKDQKRSLSDEEKRALLTSLDVAYSAPCSAFLWGDWSSLVSKKAILVPINLRVTVGIKKNQSRLKCFIYEKSQYENNWILNGRHSEKMTEVISSSWQYLSPHFMNLNMADIYVFSDVHFGCGIHESTAMFSALAGCMIRYFALSRPWSSSMAHLACIMESFYCPHVTGATKVCTCQSPYRPSVMISNRTNDGGINFERIPEDWSEIKRNRAIDPNSFENIWVDFDVTRLMVLLHRFVTIDLGEIRVAYVRILKQLAQVGFGYLCNLMEENIRNLNYERAGAMMNLHQSLISTVGIVPTDLHKNLQELQSIPNVLGIKASCSQPHGALIALIDGNPESVLPHLPDWVHVVSPFVEPTPGVVEIQRSRY